MLRFEKSSAPDHLGRYHNPDDHVFQNEKYLSWWKPIIWMAFWISLGVLVSLGHHLAYQRLDGQPQSIFSQGWAHNLGSAAAFLIKTSFTLTILLAFQEALWFSFRRKAIKISLIDKLFTLSSNPASFLSTAFVDAPLPTMLAIFAWLIPISAMLSPGSLVVEPSVNFSYNVCNVPTFAASSPNISFYQMIPRGSTVQGSNAGIQKLASQIFARGAILEPESPCGANCSFQQSFYGPALQCTNVSNPHYVYTDAYVPFSYNATNLTHFGEDQGPSMEMLITYLNYTKTTPDFDYRSILCLPYNTTYDVSVNYTNGLPRFYTNLTYNAPLLNLNYTELTQPQDTPWASNSATLVREIYDNHLRGTWEQSPVSYYSTHNTMIANTVLVGDTVDANNGRNASVWYVNRDLLTGIPELLTNLTISTLAISPLNRTENCSTSTIVLAYRYNPRQLLIPYSVALFLSLIAFIAGVCVLKITGMRTGDVFSQVLVTTRNPFLDEITRDHPLSSAGADLMKNHKLQLGNLKHVSMGGNGDEAGKDSRGVRHAAFGLAEQVDKLH